MTLMCPCPTVLSNRQANHAPEAAAAEDPVTFDKFRRESDGKETVVIR